MANFSLVGLLSVQALAYLNSISFRMTTLTKSKQVILSKSKRTTPAQSELNCFVFYTKARVERIVQMELVLRNYEVFLPLSKTLRVWNNGQKKWISKVLFPNYIFVKTTPCELYRITLMPNIICIVNCSGKPSIISAREIEQIKAILCLDKEFTVETNYTKGERVKVVKGPLRGYEGILIEQKGKTRFGFQVKDLNQTILMEISTSVLEKH